MAILLAGLGTYAMRAVFIVALAKQRFPPLALHLLEYVGPAVMGGLVVAMLSTPEGAVEIGLPELAGLASAAFVAAKTRNQVWSLVTGMTIYWVLRALVG